MRHSNFKQRQKYKWTCLGTTEHTANTETES